MALSTAQIEMLRVIERDSEPTDYAEFADRAGSALGWRNRERVITALIDRGLIDDDLHITDAGLAVLSAAGAA
jgi:hypothetical protein